TRQRSRGQRRSGVHASPRVDARVTGVWPFFVGDVAIHTAGAGHSRSAPLGARVRDVRARPPLTTAPHPPGFRRLWIAARARLSRQSTHAAPGGCVSGGRRARAQGSIETERLPDDLGNVVARARWVLRRGPVGGRLLSD